MNELNLKNSILLTDIEQHSSQYPALAKTSDGRLHFCWQVLEHGHDAVWAAVMEQGEQKAAVQISAEGEALKPVCVADGDKVWYAWGECKNRIWGIYYRCYADGSFSPIVCAAEGEALFYPCLYEKEGVVRLLWNSQGSYTGQIHLAVLGVDNVVSQEVVSVSPECYRPSFCITETGCSYVAYDRFNGSNYDVLVRTCEAGRWSDEQIISTSETAWAACPVLTSLGNEALVCWYDFDHGAAFSYHGAAVQRQGEELAVLDRTCFADGIDWYQDVAIASNKQGEAVFSYSWGKTKLHVRRYSLKHKWSAPVVMTNDDMNFASNQKILLDEDGTIHMAWQFANKNGHKPHRNAQVVYTWLKGEEYDGYVDTESEEASDPFCRPISVPKALDRIPQETTRAWMQKNGYGKRFPVFGDIHGQSGMTDGVGEIDQFFHIAKVWAGLDFTALTDHDCYPDWLSQSEWEWIRTTTRLFNVQGEMATLLAYEWTPNEYRYDFGHKNVYYRDDDGELFRSGDEGGMTPDRLFESLKNFKAMAFPHHPAASWKLVSAATDWAFHDEEIQRMVEIFSRHAPFEYYGNQSVYTKNNMQLEHCSVQDAWAKGYHMGVTAGSDSHQMEHGVEGGIVVSFVEELTNETVWDNLYDRFAYATTGAGILLSFRGNSREMGSIVTAENHVNFAVSVLGTALVKVEVLCDNQVILTREPGVPFCDFTFVRETTQAEACYYIRVTQEDDHQAWSSPIWAKSTKGESL